MEKNTKAGGDGKKGGSNSDYLQKAFALLCQFKDINSASVGACHVA